VNNPIEQSPLEPVNVAVIGLGFMGITHLLAYQNHPMAQVTAVCGLTHLPVNGVLRGIAGNIKTSDAINLGPNVKVVSAIEDVLNDPKIQLVDICTPTPMHPRHVIAALMAGKDVICEKPLARTSKAAREILDAAENSPGLLMPAMCMRFWPGWSLLKQILMDNTYGKVRAARFSRMSELPKWSKQDSYASGNDSGGALFDLHIHDTDFINFLFGRPRAVFSSGVLAADNTIHHSITQYDYPEGPVVHAEGSWLLAQGFNMAYTLHCERATLDFDLSRGPNALLISEIGAPIRTIELDQEDGYTHEINYMLECVKERRAPNIVTAHDGLVALEICEAEEQSIRTGALVKL
jgi:predicted dehydrogenase